MIIRSLFARLAFMADTRKLKDFNLGLKRVKQSMIGLAALWGVGTVALGGFIREAAKLEQIKVAFKTMLGSAGLAKETLAELFEFARVTPFEIPGVLGTARILLGMGSAARDLRPQLKMIGDIAAGLSVPLEQIAMSFGKVQAAGYLTGYELQNLRRAGVPLVKELSAILGKDREAVQHMVRTRKVSFDLFQQAFKNMTEAGGVFHNLMFEQAKTLLGIISNIKDAIRITAMEAGEILLPTVKKFTQGILLWLEANKKIIRLRIGNFLKILGKYLAEITGFLFEVVRGFYLFAEALGGTEKVLKILLVTMTGLIMLGFASAIGYITIGLYKLAAAAIAGQVAFTAWPLVIGLAFGFLYLAIDDLYRYLTGWKGKTVAGWFDEKFLGGNLKKKFNDFKGELIDIKDLVHGLGLLIAGLFTGDFGEGGMFRRGLAVLDKISLREKEKRAKEHEKALELNEKLFPSIPRISTIMTDPKSFAPIDKEPEGGLWGTIADSLLGAADKLRSARIATGEFAKKQIDLMNKTYGPAFAEHSNRMTRLPAEAALDRRVVKANFSQNVTINLPPGVDKEMVVGAITESGLELTKEFKQVIDFKRDQN